MVFLSPGVKTEEVDFSTYVGQVSSCIAGIVGGASRGPLNVPTLCTSPNDFVEQFGEPIAEDFGALAALEYLKQGNQLFYVRVAETAAAEAKVTFANGAITATAKEKGSFFEKHKFGVALTELTGNIATIVVYKDGLAEEQLQVSLVDQDPDYPFIEKDSVSHWVKFTLETPAADVPEITKFTDEAFVNDASNKWTIIKDSDQPELTVLKFKTNIPVAATSLVNVSDSESLLNPGETLCACTVQGDEITCNIPGGTFDFSKAASTPWQKEFSVNLISDTGVESQEIIRIEAVNSGTSTTVTPGEDSDGATSVINPEGSFDIEASDEVFYLVGGNNGCPLEPGTVIGTGTDGLQAFRNTEELDVNIIAAPGFTQASVQMELINIAESRADAIAILDTPQNLSRQDAIAYHNGTLEGEDYPKAPLNSSYAAIYYPWVQIYDAYSGENKWVPPSGVVMGAFAYNDANGQPWFAPAGLNRGMLTSVLAVERSLDEGSRDALYGNGNAINAIVNYKRQGISIWGQRTLQRKTSALDRVNVRRLMNMIRKAIAASTAYIIFEQIDEITWRQWVGTIEPYMESIKQSRGVYDYKVVMDSTTVTAYHQSRNEMPGQIYIQPTKTAEFIPISFIISADGASFEAET